MLSGKHHINDTTHNMKGARKTNSGTEQIHRAGKHLIIPTVPSLDLNSHKRTHLSGIVFKLNELVSAGISSV